MLQFRSMARGGRGMAVFCFLIIFLYFPGARSSNISVYQCYTSIQDFFCCFSFNLQNDLKHLNLHREKVGFLGCFFFPLETFNTIRRDEHLGENSQLYLHFSTSTYIPLGIFWTKLSFIKLKDLGTWWRKMLFFKKKSVKFWYGIKLCKWHVSLQVVGVPVKKENTLMLKPVLRCSPLIPSSFSW